MLEVTYHLANIKLIGASLVRDPARMDGMPNHRETHQRRALGRLEGIKTSGRSSFARPAAKHVDLALTTSHRKAAPQWRTTRPTAADGTARRRFQRRLAV